MKKISKYYLHSQESWSESDAQEIRGYLNSLSFIESPEAAIGEGAGGPGWETIIEVVLQISATASLGEQIWRLARFLRNKRPKPKAPEGQTEIYKMVVHFNTTIISLNLLDDEDSIREATDKLDNASLKNAVRMHQNGSNWDKY